MRLEGNDPKRGAEVLRLVARKLDHRLVPAVDAIEIADGHHRPPPVGPYRLVMGDETHG